MGYGIPVYNLTQEESTFSVAGLSGAKLETARNQGLVSYTQEEAGVGNKSGRDNFYSKEIIPPYPTSFLLSAILSPDYVDVTGNGISDDDLGTAIKFKYVKLNGSYKWRAPYSADQANFNEGFISDPKDDRANLVYGEKEIWYLESVESSTMIAVFETSDRVDGLGVTSASGKVDKNFKLRKLDKIKLYSKADYRKNGSNATPIKTANFVYNESLYRGVPNNSANADGNLTSDPVKGGKLTLVKVYFTFGKSSRASYNPYEFEYDTRPVNNTIISGLPAIPAADAEYTDNYTTRQTDRWGSYKKSFFNRGVNTRQLNNSEFPYTLQQDANSPYNVSALNNLLISKWQLTKIKTPAGSIISVEYESDNYAYVQDKRAMQMCFVDGIDNAGSLTDPAAKLKVRLPVAVNDFTQFKQLYLKNTDGSFQTKLFFKLFTDIDNRDHFEYVHGYGELDPGQSAATGFTAYLAFKPINNSTPMAAAAWQLLQTDLPQYAYDSYDNSDVGDGEGAIRSIIAAFGNLRELVQPFAVRAKNRGFAAKINPNYPGTSNPQLKSMIRLYNPDYKKMGGGARVKKIEVSDEWAAIAGGDNGATAYYGQTYEYDIKDAQGNTISSSGVASYEPQIGNEENPFHEPDDFVEKVHWGNDRFHYVEKPYCETYFPAPSVGYSLVRVTSFGRDDAGGVLATHTGYTESGFYTAKDFPTIVDKLPIQKNNYENSLLRKLFSSSSRNAMTVSQGFKIELNDMHGKPKFTKVYNSGGDLISSVENFYNVNDERAALKTLKNSVDVLRTTGLINNAEIATDFDLITDVRQSTNENTGTSIGVYVGGAIFWVLPVFYGAAIPNKTVSSTRFNSASLVKVINRFGILKRTKTVQNGSSIESENLLWDPQTGEVLLSRTQNEFDQNTYAFSYPAFMAYEGMGPATLNQGIVINNPATTSDGKIKPIYQPYFFPGDEIFNLSTNQRGWIIKSSDNSLRLIDERGEFMQGLGTVKILRSGRRNQLTADAGTVVSMQDPRVNGRLKLDNTRKILDAKAIVYQNEWPLPEYPVCPSCPTCRQVSGRTGTPNPAVTFNPYFAGFLGNWRPSASYVYTVNRTLTPGVLNQSGNSDIRTSGSYASFNPFWTFQNTGSMTNTIPYGGDQPANDNRWVWNQKAVYYDQKGNEVETVDALQRYGAALFGYQQTLAVAVGQNARKNEIAFDGFEDYDFNLNESQVDNCGELKRHINFKFNKSGTNWTSPAGSIVSAYAHSGKYSWLINGNQTVTQNSGTAAPVFPVLAFDAPGHYLLSNVDQNSVFAPVPGKKYIFSCWVKDQAPNTNKIQGLSLNINGAAYNTNSIVQVVEGWKRLEFPFVAASNFQLTISGSGIYIDDIRIFPDKGLLKTFVYDDVNLRLTAQIDENNFATFYEYDDAGTPIRVKKETERGIMTIKENRQSYRKRQ